MKVGIVTFHADANYGAFFQAYALQTYLEHCGHNPFFIRWSRYEATPPAQSRSPFSWVPRKPIQRMYGRVFRRKFRRFAERHLRTSEISYGSFEAIAATPPEAGAYICGSDQVWNPRFVSARRQPIAWLCFGDRAIRRIAYAPSFGRTQLEPELISRWSEYAKGLDKVSVREESGIQLMEQLGRQDAQWVPDPTLLLGPADYAHLGVAAQEQCGGYVCAYIVTAGNDNSVVYAAVKKHIRHHRRLSLWECRPKRRPLRDLLAGKMPGPHEWLGRLRNADFVITNSFHGLMFSLIFHRPFVAILRSGRGVGLNARVESILRIAGLTHRAIADYDSRHVERLCADEIDWGDVDRRLAEFRNAGQRFLQSSLEAE